MKIGWTNLEQEWRKELLSHATGNILEVGVGTGDNFKYYPLGVTVTATDMSKRMIEKAKTEAAASGVKTTFVVSAVDELQLPTHGFDTIVSTFSLSAYETPMEVLEKFNNWCRPDGLILLLEYGISKCGVVGWLQRKWEPYHYKKTGNHLDRDMMLIISGSGLCIKKVEIKYAGIVYLVWATLRPRT